jgi:hypothetical protein
MTEILQVQYIPIIFEAESSDSAVGSYIIVRERGRRKLRGG